FWDAHPLGLRAIAVGDHASLDIVGTAWHVGEARRRQAARARLGQRNPPPAFAEHGADDLFDGFAIGADQVVPEDRLQLVHAALNRREPRGRVGAYRGE